MIDHTLSLDADTPTFPGYPGFRADRRVSDATGAISHRFEANTHLGTHVDAPAHFVDGGTTVDRVDPERWVGPARVVDLRPHRGEEITAAHLDEAAPGIDGERVLLVAGDVDASFGEASFFDEATVLTESAATWLVERDVRLVANDFLTEAIDEPARPVHHRLLGAEVPIVEYVCNVAGVADRETVELLALPLRLAGLEAAPARVLSRPSLP